MPNNKVNKTVKDFKQGPNDRERLVSQFGQLDDLTSTYWAANPPKTIQEAIERLAKQVYTAHAGTPIPE